VRFVESRLRLLLLTTDNLPRATMSSDERRFVSQLGHNEAISQVFLASEKQLRPNRNGNLYLQVDLSDRSGAVNARLWNATDTDYKAFENGDFVHVEGATQLFQGNMQLIANRIRLARPDEVFEGDFITLQSADIDKMRTRLVEITGSVQSPPLARLAKAFVKDDAFMAKFCQAPAGMKNHHAYKGGLLEHVLSLMELVLVVAPKYPQLSQDKLLLGALLHDAAKVEELAYERPGATAGAYGHRGDDARRQGATDRAARWPAVSRTAPHRTQAHDYQPSWRVRIWQQQIADDARSDCVAHARQPGREGGELYATDDGLPQRGQQLDAVFQPDRPEVVQAGEGVDSIDQD